MKQGKVNSEVVVAFALGAAAGALGVGVLTQRSVDAEHRQAVRMAGAAQMAQAMGRMEVIRAQQLAASAIQEAQETSERAKRERDEVRREMAAARPHGPER